MSEGPLESFYEIKVFNRSMYQTNQPGLTKFLISSHIFIIINNSIFD